MPNTVQDKRPRTVRERRDRRRNRRLVGLKPNQVREGVLVAEGDSWFSFPYTNVLYQLRCLGYSITSVAESGDTMAEMAENKDELEVSYKRAVRDHGVVDAVLLSGGGNEVMAGRLGSMLLRKGAAGTLNNNLVKTTINEIKGSYTLKAKERCKVADTLFSADRQQEIRFVDPLGGIRGRRPPFLRKWQPPIGLSGTNIEDG